MARIRTIKPEFWDDEKIASLPMPCRLFYIGCWNFADDCGVIRANASLLKSKIFPYDDNLRVSEVQKWIDALVKARMLVPVSYKDESYYVIRTFRSHQKFDPRYVKNIIPSDLVDEVLEVKIENDDTTSSTQCEHIEHTPREGEGEREYKEIYPNGYTKKGEPSGSEHESSEDFIKFKIWIKENAPFCSNPKNFTKQITEKNFLTLKTKYSGKQIADTILDLENRKDLRKRYCDLYKTINNWLKREYG